MPKIVRCPECGDWNKLVCTGVFSAPWEPEMMAPTFAPVKGLRCTCAYEFTGRERAIREGNFADDSIQFPRILAELYSIGIPKELFDALRKTTDLTRGQIVEILARADQQWQRIKHGTG